MVCNTGGDRESGGAGVETLLEQRVAGFGFRAFSGDSRTMRETLQHGVPAVFVSCQEDGGDVVAVDGALGGRLAMRHLIASGHRRIAFLSIPELADSSDLARRNGCVEEATQAGVASVTRISWSPPADRAEIDGEVRELREAFTGTDRITGVFASNDLAAIDLIEFADRVGIQVPRDLSLVGFDDVPLARLPRIALTTVAQPPDELARLGIPTIIHPITAPLTRRPPTPIASATPFHPPSTP